MVSGKNQRELTLRTTLQQRHGNHFGPVVIRDLVAHSLSPLRSKSPEGVRPYYINQFPLLGANFESLVSNGTNERASNMLDRSPIPVYDNTSKIDDPRII